MLLFGNLLSGINLVKMVTLVFACVHAGTVGLSINTSFHFIITNQHVISRFYVYIARFCSWQGNPKLRLPDPLS